MYNRIIKLITNHKNNRKMENKNQENQKFIVRTDRAGVFFAEIVERNGSEAVLRNARRLWYWNGAASLSQLAMEGVTKPRECKFTMEVTECTVLGVIEIIPCTQKAVHCIKNIEPWKK